jgi:hypothetical protein
MDRGAAKAGCGKSPKTFPQALKRIDARRFMSEPFLRQDKLKVRPQNPTSPKSIVAEELNQNESRREFGVHVFYSKSTSFLQGLKPIL